MTSPKDSEFFVEMIFSESYLNRDDELALSAASPTPMSPFVYPHLQKTPARDFLLCH